MEGLVPAEVERLGPYLLLERLAPYGMVQPYLARRDGAIDLVVVKRLLPQLVRHPTAPRRFAREARLTRMLEHPHLVRTVDVGYANDELFMATELVAGVRLDVLMINAIARGRPLPLDVVSGLVQRVLAGLGHAHRAQDAGRPLGIVHRDLTPRSITVAFTGAVKLGDFGVARAKGDAALTAPGTAVGTLAYMSPEQVDRAPLDARTDLYSFSVLLYELLTGRPMVDAQDALSILKQVRELNPMPLRDRRPELPERLAQVVQRGLAKDVEDRWPDALSYEHALQEALQEVGPSASSERLGAFVRACLPDEEDHFLQMLNRVRSVSSTLPAEAYEEAPIPFDDDDDEPLPEPTPEPSVMTMPGLSLPMQQRVAVARARGPSPRRLWLMGSVVVALAALATIAAWWVLIEREQAAWLPHVAKSNGIRPSGATSDRLPLRPSPPAAIPDAGPVATVASAEASLPPKSETKTLARVKSSATKSPSAQVRPRTPAKRTVRRPISKKVARKSPNAPANKANASVANFSKRIAALRLTGDDAHAFDMLLNDMKAAAQNTEESVRRSILRDLSAAERSFDVEGLAQALRRFERHIAAKSTP